MGAAPSKGNNTMKNAGRTARETFRELRVRVLTHPRRVRHRTFLGIRFPCGAAQTNGRRPMDRSVISAVNNEEVLKSCSLSSPDIRSASEVLLQRGFSTAAAAYNAAIDQARTDLLVFVHQDVYLPSGWLDHRSEGGGDSLKTDPNWGVLGYGDLALCREVSASFTMAPGAGFWETSSKAGLRWNRWTRRC